MMMNSVYLFPIEAAANIQAELFESLREAEKINSWMDFMETVTRLMPEVLSSGRPSAEAISKSPIGLLGFKSWQEMIEASVDLGGLAWNFSAWKAWRRAWSVVLAHSWLRHEQITSSEINTLDQELKRAGKPFPSSPEALQQYMTERARLAEKKRSGALLEAQRALLETKAKLELLIEQLSQERAESDRLRDETGRLQGLIESLSVPATPPRRLTRLEHLKAAIFG